MPCPILKVVVTGIAGDDKCGDLSLFPTATLFPVPTGVEVRAETVQLQQAYLPKFTPVNAGDLELVGKHIVLNHHLCYPYFSCCKQLLPS